jgi:tetratricopeptide (TPR) repeat protein
MSESAEILRFYLDGVHQEAAEIRLRLVQHYQWDFAKLQSELYENALISLLWCRENAMWDKVIAMVSGLEHFLHRQGHWAQGSEAADYAVKAARKLGDRKAEAYWTYFGGLMQAELGYYNMAKHRYQNSLLLAQAKADLGLQAEVHRRLGWVAQAEGDRAAAVEFYRQALELHGQLNDPQGQARDWRQLGLLAMETGDLEQAEGCMRTSLDLVEGQQDEETQQPQAGAWLDLGRIALQRRQFDQAQQHLACALPHAEAAQDRLLIADIRFHMGTLAEEHGDLQEAEVQYRAVRRQALATGNRQAEASALIALGTLDMKQGNYGRAQEYFAEAVKFANRHNLAVARLQLGTLTYYQADYEQASGHLQAALEEFRTLERKAELAGCHHQLGLVAQATSQWQAAEEHYQTSLRLRQKLGLPGEIVTSYYQLGTLAQIQTKYDLAESYYEKALAVEAAADAGRLQLVRKTLDDLRAYRRQGGLS